MNDKTMLAAYSLLDAVTALSEILDQPIDEKGDIKVKLTYAAKLIVSTQLCARNAIDKIHDLIDD